MVTLFTELLSFPCSGEDKRARGRADGAAHLSEPVGGPGPRGDGQLHRAASYARQRQRQSHPAPLILAPGESCFLNKLKKSILLVPC